MIAFIYPSAQPEVSLDCTVKDKLIHKERRKYGMRELNIAKPFNPCESFFFLIWPKQLKVANNLDVITIPKFSYKFSILIHFTMFKFQNMF